MLYYHHHQVCLKRCERIKIYYYIWATLSLINFSLTYNTIPLKQPLDKEQINTFSCMVCVFVCITINVTELIVTYIIKALTVALSKICSNFIQLCSQEFNALSMFSLCLHYDPRMTTFLAIIFKGVNPLMLYRVM